MFGVFSFGQPYFGQTALEALLDFNPGIVPDKPDTSYGEPPKMPISLFNVEKPVTSFSDSANPGTGFSDVPKPQTSYNDMQKPFTDY